MNSEIIELIKFILSNNRIGNKYSLIEKFEKKFIVKKDSKIFYNNNFAIRFSQSASTSFSNTVASLSSLQKYDDRPFFVCLVTPEENIIYLSNSTFIKKISHSSHNLSIDNIKGSFNGTDILKEFNFIKNNPENFSRLFEIHQKIGFNKNLIRLVDSTNNILPSRNKITFNELDTLNIISAPKRALEFVSSAFFTTLKRDLDFEITKYKKEIINASNIDNVKLRGDVIEYLISGKDERIKNSLVKFLNSPEGKFPKLKSKNSLDDSMKNFHNFSVAIDIKSKISGLDSSPKGYNIDKFLQFLSKSGTVFLIYFIKIDKTKEIVTSYLVPVFQEDLISSAVVQKHWAGRNSKGAIQFQGHLLNNLFTNSSKNILIDEKKSVDFLNKLLKL